MSQLFSGKDNLSAHWKHTEGMSLRYGVTVLRGLMQNLSLGMFH